MKKALSKRMLAFFIACLMVVTACLTVTINAAEWDYDDEGTGLPDADDENKGLPYYVNGKPIITDYGFSYLPEVYGYGEDGTVDFSAPITSAKAGDVVWFKLSVTDINRDLAKNGFFSFDGYYTYDVENIDRYYGGLPVVESNPTKGTLPGGDWFEKFLNLNVTDDMYWLAKLEVNFSRLFSSTYKPSGAVEDHLNGYGQHFSVSDNDIIDDECFGIIEDGQFFICVPLQIASDVSELDSDGNVKEFTFTVPYPNEEQVGSAYEANGEKNIVVYGSGGSYTITIDNHDDVLYNLAADAVYAAVKAGASVNDKSKGYLNDLLYPLTENSKYTQIGGDAVVEFELSAPSEVSSVVITFNDTEAAELPSLVTVLGVKDDGTYDILGEVSVGTPYYSGVVDSKNYADLVGSVTVNAANAYQYTVSDFDPAIYNKIFISATADENDAGEELPLAIGEVEIIGELAKVSVEIVNGTIVNSTPDGLYYPGTEIVVIADPADAHKSFDAWTVDGSGSFEDESASTTTYVVGTTDSVITATYTDVLYPLEVINGEGDGEFVFGNRVAITADAPVNSDLVFDRWEVVEGDAYIVPGFEQNPNAVVITGTNSIIEAIYKDREYALTVENGEGDGNYKNGSDATITADAPSADMKFDHWEIVEGNCYIADIYSSETNVVTTGADTTVRAVYTDILYDVTVNLGDISEDDYNEDGYSVGTEITIIADEIPHKVFDHWEIVGNGTFADDESAETLFTTGSGDMVITAVYTDALYSLTVEGGSGSGDEYKYQDLVDIALDVNEIPIGYEFDKWVLVDGNAIIRDAFDENTVVTVLSDCLVVATYKLSQYNVGVINGAVSDDDYKDSYNYGDVVVIIADSPDAHKQFAGWEVVSGECVLEDANASTTKITVVTSDVVVKAIFTDVQYTLTVIGGTNSGQYKYGDVVNVDVTDKDSVFEAWIIVEGDENVVINDANKSNTTVTVLGDVTIQATFAELYSVDVINGQVTVGKSDDGYVSGSVITVVADAPAVHKQFAGWEVVEGQCEINDPSLATIIVTVGTEDVVLRAKYTDMLYTLNVVNGDGDGNYAFGSTVKIEAGNHDSSDLVFDKWVVVSGNAQIADVNNPETVVTMGTDSTVEATYKTREFSLTVENGTGSGNFASGTTAPISANSPAADMEFDKWVIVTGHCEITDPYSPDTTVITNGDATTVRATYKDKVYNVTVNNGTITEGENADGYTVGSTIVIVADEIPNKVFDHWEVVGNGSFENYESAETTFTTGSGDMIITPVYRDALYSLVVNGGTGSKDDCLFEQKVEISANVADGLVFVKWELVSGNAIISNASAADTSVTVLSDTVIKAVFEEAYTVDIVNGVVSDGDEKEYYSTGDVITIVADAPAADKYFAGWIIDGQAVGAVIADSNSATTTLTIGTSDVVVTATYEDILYKLVIENGSSANINPEGNVAGSKIDIEADDAPDGYVFDKWVIVIGSGTIEDADSSETIFIVGSGDAVIKATYKVKPTDPSGDNGIATFGVLAAIALAGSALAIRKKRK